MLVFRLYISGGAPSSTRALDNLKAVCKEYFPNDHRIEVVDTLLEPLRAMQDGIIVTPSLVKLSPEPSWTIIGDLSEDARVLASMRETNGDHQDRAYSGQALEPKATFARSRKRGPKARTVTRNRQSSSRPVRSKLRRGVEDSRSSQIPEARRSPKRSGGEERRGRAEGAE